MKGRRERKTMVGRKFFFGAEHLQIERKLAVSMGESARNDDSFFAWDREREREREREKKSITA